jgi:hypothetical protein
MASILQVEELRGATSGANANKIIIPSGQTLDASAGFVPPAGSVVQVVQYYNANASQENTTSTSWTASIISKTITPKYSDSLIVVQASVSMADGQNDSLRAKMYINGSPMSGANEYHVVYQDHNTNRYSPVSFQGQHTCTSTDALNFRVYYKSSGGGSVRITHSLSSSALTLWEIKQ